MTYLGEPLAVQGTSSGKDGLWLQWTDSNGSVVKTFLPPYTLIDRLESNGGPHFVPLSADEKARVQKIESTAPGPVVVSMRASHWPTLGLAAVAAGFGLYALARR